MTPPTLKDRLKAAAIVILILLLLLIGGCRFLRHPKSTPVAEQPATPSPAPATAPAGPPEIKPGPPPTPPPYEAYFIQSVKQYQKGLSPTADAAQIKGIRDERARGISNSLPGVRTIENWTGIVRKIQPVTGGKLAIAIELPETTILVQTWPDLLSDAGSDTLIDPKSELSQRLHGMAVGAPVSFDGEFLPDPDDWVKEGSKTPNEGIVSPKYILHFKDVRRAGK